jgi:hypothetical protein
VDEGPDLLVRDQVEDERFVVGGVELVVREVGERLCGGGESEAVPLADDRRCRAVDRDARAGPAIGIEEGDIDRVVWRAGRRRQRTAALRWLTTALRP